MAYGKDAQDRQCVTGKQEEQSVKTNGKRKLLLHLEFTHVQNKTKAGFRKGNLRRGIRVSPMRRYRFAVIKLQTRAEKS